MRRRNTSGAYFCHAAVGSLGVTAIIHIFAKGTYFQGAFLLNYGCTMRGMMRPRLCYSLLGPGAGSAQVFSPVMCNAGLRRASSVIKI